MTKTHIVLFDIYKILMIFLSVYLNILLIYGAKFYYLGRIVEMKYEEEGNQIINKKLFSRNRDRK